MVEFARTKEEAHAIAAAATRTWGVWLGVGDVTSQRFLAIEYMRASAHTYNASTLPALTGSPPLSSASPLEHEPDLGGSRSA